MIEINTNDDVWIKLTEKGDRILAAHEGLYRFDREGDDGFIKFHLHEVMNIFGKKMFCGADLVFETTMKVEAETNSSSQEE